MKLTNLLSKVMVISIITTGAFMTTASFADEINTTPVIEDQQIEKSANPFREKVKLSPQEKIIELATEYAPETLGDWESIFSSKETIKADIDNLKSEIEPLTDLYKEDKKAEAQAEKEAFVSDLRTKVENGELTEEEAADIYDAEKSIRMEAAEIRKAQRETKKAEIMALREEEKLERQNLREMMKLAIEGGNDSEIASILSDMLSKAEASQARAYNKVNVLTERLAELQN